MKLICVYVTPGNDPPAGFTLYREYPAEHLRRTEMGPPPSGVCAVREVTVMGDDGYRWTLVPQGKRHWELCLMTVEAVFVEVAE